MSKDIAAHPRRHIRYDATEANVTGSICQRKDALLKDISLGGASFLLKQEIEINSSCRVDLDYGADRFHVKAKVAWMRRPGDVLGGHESQQDMFTIGVVFVNTYDTESGTNLKRLIEKLDERQTAHA